MKTSNEINELCAALAKAQGEFQPIERTRTVTVTMKSGGSYKFDYAPLDTILAATMPALAKNGLSVAWYPEVSYTEGNEERHAFADVRQTCRLMHSSGQWQEATVQLRTNELAPQGMGSVLTYGRRYSFEHVVGVVSETDDDGNGAAGNQSENTKRKPNPDCPKCKVNHATIKGKEEFGGGWLCWKNKGGCGHKWQDSDKETAMDNLPHDPPKASAADAAKQTAADKRRAAIKRIRDSQTLEDLETLAKRLEESTSIDPVGKVELKSLIEDQRKWIETQKTAFDAAPAEEEAAPL